jgi:hypothetical protein
VRSHAALEGFGVDGMVKEPRRDTQRANPIIGSPGGTDLVGIACGYLGDREPPVPKIGPSPYWELNNRQLQINSVVISISYDERPLMSSN